MNFREKLRGAWEKNNSLVCVGLDPLLEKLPDTIKSSKRPIFDFNKALIDRTADLVCAYKPQIAYYSAQSAEDQLEETIEYIHNNYPAIPVVLDAKRNDIGSTAEQYAKEVYDRYKADAATVNPYMGSDSIEPFIERQDRGVIILCRTSNPGAVDVQNLKIEDEPVYKKIATLASTTWNGNKNVALVVGATYPNEMKEIREIVGDIPFLVPGVGVQDGDIESSVIYGKDSSGTGLMMSSSRGVNYASSGDDFAEAARKVVLELRGEINSYRDLPV